MILKENIEKIILENDDAYSSYKLSKKNICNRVDGISQCDQAAPDIFFQLTTIDVTYVCIKCKENHFSAIKTLTSTHKQTLNNNITIVGPLTTFPSLECLIQDNDSLQNPPSNNVCEYYYPLSNDKYGCLKCPFGMTGTIIKDESSGAEFGYLTDCVPITKSFPDDLDGKSEGSCDTETIYQGYTNDKDDIRWNLLPLEAYITCFKCIEEPNNKYKPFIFIDFHDDSTTSSGYSQTGVIMNIPVFINPYSIKDKAYTDFPKG